jgi:hypothetical protein
VINGDRLSISHASNLPPGLVEEIRADKSALMAALRSRPACAETTPGTPQQECSEPAPDETDEALRLGLNEEHRAILEAAMRHRPNDVDGAQLDAAMRGLRTFLASGRADEALRLGWPHDELFAVPPLWANVALCGAGLLIGDREVVEVTADRIQIKTTSGATLSFYRRPQPDYALVYGNRRKSLARNLGEDEAHFRAFDFTINFCCEHSGCDLEKAKALVRAAIAKAAANDD